MRKLFFLMLLSGSICAGAQTSDLISKTVKNSVGDTIYFEPAPGLDTTKEVMLLKEIFRCSDDIRFEKIRSVGKGSLCNNYYRQYFRNVLVRDGGFVIHSESGIVKSGNGRFVRIQQTITPKISSDFAVGRVASLLKKKLPEKARLRILPSRLELMRPEPAKSDAKLYYVFEILDGFLSYTALIDALTGEAMPLESDFCSASAVDETKTMTGFRPSHGYLPETFLPNASGSGASLYSSTVNFVADYTGTDYRLRENTNGVDIITLNAKNLASFSSAVDVLDNDNNWTATEHPTLRQAFDAHWGAEKVLAYWDTKHGRNSLDDNGITLKSLVKYDTGLDNAYWAGNADLVAYGDGATRWNPSPSLDLVAHEFGHGINKFTAGLSSTNPVNEGLSDIWGAAVEAWAAPGKQKWTMFEEIMKSAPYERSFTNPKSGYVPQPDTKGGTYWQSTVVDPHVNAGILTKWFSLLVDGGSGTNDLGNFYSVAGIGMDNATAIVYNAELNISSVADYDELMLMTINAAANTCEEIALKQAWYAVGVRSSPYYQIGSGASVLCTGSTYSVSNASSITWSVTPSGIATLSTSGTSATLTPVNSSVRGLVTLTGDIPGCSSAVQVIKPVWVGKAMLSSEEYLTYYGGPGDENQVCKDAENYFHFGVAGPSVAQSVAFTWVQGTATPGGLSSNSFTTPPGNPLYTDNGLYLYMWKYPQTVSFTVTLTNACGTSAPETIAFTTVDCSSMMMFEVSPNPTTGAIRVHNKTKEKKIIEIRITDKFGNIRKVERFGEGTDMADINISSLSPDVYYVLVYDGRKWHSRSIIKQ